MRRIVLVVLALNAIVGCTSDSSLPDPTGKGTVRAINAIESSPDIAFLIEELLLERVGYKDAANSRRWDDFEYRFNFEILFPGDTQATRVASVVQKIDADRDYTFVATGAFDAPTILVWEADERRFDNAATVFEARFAHVAPSLGDVDLYFAPDGTAPVLGEQRGTLSFGDALDPIDIDGGDYVLTLTTAGDPTDIAYQSGVVTYAAGVTLIIPVFDADALDTAPFNVRAFNAIGGTSTLPDSRFPPTIRFIQASFDLTASDVYDDEMLMSQVLSDHRFGDVTGDIDIAVGTTDFRYTPFGDTSMIQFEASIDAVSGTRYNFIVIGESGSRSAATFVPDRRSDATIAALQIFAAALNHASLDLYIVDSGTSIDEASPVARLAYGFQLGNVVLDAGSYDLYLTVVDEKTVVAGPVPLDLALGDNVESIVLDTVDPATAEFRILPAP